ncbi:MAG: twin-arginine translocation signal domain-containing protein, partial [Terriglobia bacterium]
MQTLDRRDFLKVSAAAGTVGLMHGLPAAPAQKGMRLGLILDMGRDPDKALQKVHDLGIPTCQVSTEDLSDAMLEGIREAVRK